MTTICSSADSCVCYADMRGDIRSEWDETKQHDVLFLLTVRPPDQAELALMQQDGKEPHPAERFGLTYVRGCEVIEVKDEGTAIPVHANSTAQQEECPCIKLPLLRITGVRVQ